MFKQFLQSTLKNKTELIKFGDELCQKGKQAIDLYREISKVVDEVNDWPHPMWWSNTFKAWTFKKGQDLYKKYEGTPFLTSFKEVWTDMKYSDDQTNVQTLFFLFHKMELNQISNLKNHVWKVDQFGEPRLEIETPLKPKMSFFLAQELKEQNVRLKAELEALKKEEYFG